LNGEELQAVANAATTDLPGVTLEHRHGPNWAVYKVRGKVFMLHAGTPGGDPESRSRRRRGAA
jgi:hypothetical protein